MSGGEFYWFWLANIRGIGYKKQKRLLEALGEPRAVYEARRERLEQIPGLTVKDAERIAESRKKDRICRAMEELAQCGICFTCVEDKSYPAWLKNIYDPPHVFYYKGRLPAGDVPAVAVVGARDCTEYGRYMAQWIGKTLGRAGVQVISGLARGIDAFAHEGALQGEGETFAVMAGGADICYPPENNKLYRQIARTGGILSEMPLHTQPSARLFPVRNRIISGLAQAVVVVEARIKSGSLITADAALEQNRQVYVVPGRIKDALSEGCLWLAGQGAQVLTHPRQILEDLGITDSMLQIQKINNISLETSEKIVYSCLGLLPVSLHVILEKTGMEVGQVMNILLRLELAGRIRKTGCQSYVKQGEP